MTRTFSQTQPSFDTVLPRVSDFQRRQRQLGHSPDAGAGSTLQSTLDVSLLQDLQRFEKPAGSGCLEVLEVMAAAVRHGRALRLLLEHEGLVLPLTVKPQERLVHAPLALAQWSLLRWSTLKVLQVEPAAAAEPATLTQGAPLGVMQQQAPLGVMQQQAPLSLVLWALALEGSRADLLPEIAGPVAYRIVPGTDLSGLDLAGLLASAVTRLQRQTTTLGELSQWPGFDRERATRLLNGLYLQAGLMITRTRPAAMGAH